MLRKCFNNVLRERHQLNLANYGLFFSAFNLAELNELLTQLLKPERVTVNSFQLIPFPRIGSFFDQGCYGTEDERKRGSELMRNIGEELKLVIVQFFHLLDLELVNRCCALGTTTLTDDKHNSEL